MGRTAVIVIGGGAPDERRVRRAPGRAPRHRGRLRPGPARVLGLTVDLLVGDLDSVSATGLAAAEAAGTAVERHPPAKDATDTELAIAAALARRLRPPHRRVGRTPRRRPPPRPRAGRPAGLHPAGPGRRPGRALVGLDPPRGPARPGAAPALRRPAGRHRLAPAPPRPGLRDRHHRSALPAAGRGARPREQPRHEQRRRGRAGLRRGSSSAPCSSSTPERLETPHDLDPDGPSCRTGALRPRRWRCGSCRPVAAAARRRRIRRAAPGSRC